jgi:hypothetical protein
MSRKGKQAEDNQLLFFAGVENWEKVLNWIEGMLKLKTGKPYRYNGQIYSASNHMGEGYSPPHLIGAHFIGVGHREKLRIIWGRDFYPDLFTFHLNENRVRNQLNSFILTALKEE